MHAQNHTQDSIDISFSRGLLMLLLVGMLFTVGCFDSDDDNNDSGAPMTAIEINPSAVDIDVSETSQTVILSASNGTGNYTWSVSDPNLGTVQTTGASVLYQSTQQAGENIVSVIDDASGVGNVVISQR